MPDTTRYIDVLAMCSDRQAVLETLDHEAPGGVAVEVGVACGSFIRQILATWSRVGKIYGVDNWKDQDDTYQSILGAFANESRVKFIRDWSVAASAKFDDRSLDFVYIDADHAYEAVRDDLAAWWPKVKKSGVMAGHDYGVPYFGVRQAVDEFAQIHDLPLFKTANQFSRDTAIYPGSWEGQSWILRKPS